jgi:hypothetical protein
MTRCIQNGIFWKELPSSRRDSYRAGVEIKNLQLFTCVFLSSAISVGIVTYLCKCMEFVRRNQSLAKLPRFQFLTDYIFLEICRRICALSTEFRVAR